VLSAIICQRKTQEWLELLLKADVPCAPVQEIAGLAEDEHLQKAGFIERLEHPTEGEIATIDFAVSMSETPYRLRRHAPKLAADTADVLEEFGFSSNEIKGFVEIGLVQLPLAR
jgi:crotonobetainyl-CoA:carnitine CoA-transferase CaiB-like acyl-CoA transferase